MPKDVQDSLSQEARDFLGRTHFGHVIDGEVRHAPDAAYIASLNPSTGEVLANLRAGTAIDIDEAVAAARRAFEGPWSTWSPYDRQRLLFRAADVIDEHYKELAEIESLDMGSPISRTQASQKSMRTRIQYFASLALGINGETIPNGLPGKVMSYTTKAPAGVIGGIVPWNGPLVAQWWIIGAVLATGCTVILKPAEDASLSILRMVELLNEKAGVPPGVLNVVTGAGSVVGEALARHPDVDRVAFTGSTATGRKIIEASAVNIKRLQLELGGKSADIILEDADLDKAVPGSAMGIFNNSGQICYAGSRVLVQRSILDAYIERLLPYVKTLRIGPSLDPQAQLGPVISEKQLNSILSFIDIGKSEGARLLCGGERLQGDLENGYFISPTVFTDVSNDMTIAQEEIFGPVMSIIPFDTAEDAIRIANDSKYGLGGGVWSQNVTSALKVVDGVKTGVMWVNCYGIMDSATGFGGTKMSGYGAKGSSAHLDNYLYTKSVYIQS